MPLPQLHPKCLNQLVFQLLFHHLSKLYCDISSIKTELSILIQKRACNIYAIIFESLNHKKTSLKLLRTLVTSFHSCIYVFKIALHFIPHIGCFVIMYYFHSLNLFLEKYFSTEGDCSKLEDRIQRLVFLIKFENIVYMTSLG